MPKIQKTQQCYIGIDPGKSGGFVALLPPNEVHWLPMPPTLYEIRDWLFNHCLFFRVRALLEQVHSSPQMGVASAFTFGRGFGQLEMALVATGISWEPVQPLAWQKGLRIPPRNKGTKARVRRKVKGKLQTVVIRRGEETPTAFKTRLLIRAQQLFPRLDLWKKGKGVQLAVCDALLIAEYCRRSGNS